MQLGAILALAVYLINLGYAFDGSGTPLRDFTFVSKLLTGRHEPGIPGNRFRNAWFGSLPIPLPKQYVLGFDAQKRDFEDYPQESYLGGEWKAGGWWYYYLYGLMVKVPCGTLCLFALAVASRLWPRAGPALLRDELVLLTPAMALFVLVSSQTEFNIHLRYAFPSLALALIFIGRCGSYLVSRTRVASMVVRALVGYSVISSLGAYPHHLAYFNEAAGGTRDGYKRLRGSSFDWGQDWLVLAKWLDKHPGCRPAWSREDVVASYRVEDLIPRLRNHRAPRPGSLDDQCLARVSSCGARSEPDCSDALNPCHRVGVFHVRLVKKR